MINQTKFCSFIVITFIYLLLSGCLNSRSSSYSFTEVIEDCYSKHANFGKFNYCIQKNYLGIKTRKLKIFYSELNSIEEMVIEGSYKNKEAIEVVYNAYLESFY